MQADCEFIILQQTPYKGMYWYMSAAKKTTDHFEVDQARFSQLLYLSKCSP